MKSEGLTGVKARELLSEFGFNELPTKKGASALKLLVYQFKSILVYLLFAAATISFLVHDYIDAFLITAIVLLNSLLSFWQEYKASKELQALKRMEVSFSRVLRDGIQKEIPSRELVSGDIIILESGDRVPADCELIEEHNLSVNESALTGEAMPVTKNIKIGEKSVYLGTTVNTGRGRAIVLKTGKSTRFGTIAELLSNVEEEPTPLEVSLNNLGKKIGFISVGVTLIIFTVRYFQGATFFDVFFSSTALLVAAVPEGLPAVISIALALGVRRMYKNKALVRRMSSIESLGATTVICSDKTGTLTENKMTVKSVFLVDNDQENLLFKTAVICNNASLVLKENPPGDHSDQDSLDILGDTTEGALLIWAHNQGMDIDLIRNEGKIIEEMSFDASIKRMSVLWQEKDKKMVYTKGAPDTVLPLCKLTEKELEKYNKEYEHLAKAGLRVLAFATGINYNIKIDEANLTFLGFIGIADTIRAEALQTIQKAKLAGIKIVMVTGDNPLTAKSVAEEIGMLSPGDEILTGQQIDELSDEEFSQRITNVKVFARVLPEHKLKIIKAYQQIGEVVAVTGDGVNDALALKQAHVGVAMGNIGTDVAKEASDVVILNDNLATVVLAIEQGRLIYNNILKVVKFMMTGNLSEVLVIFLAVIFALPSPLLAIQILWINFVTDGLPALALTLDPASSKVMLTPPRDTRKSILDQDALKFIFGFGIIIALLVLAVFMLTNIKFGLEVARSYAFSAMVLFQMILVMAMRRHHGFFSNKPLLIAVSGSILIQGVILLYPPIQILFQTNSGF